MDKKSVNLSEPGKMPCYTWSLPAFNTCPGAVNNYTAYSGYLKDYQKFRKSMHKKDQVQVCKGCYAQYGNYTFPGPIKFRKKNLIDWKRKDFVKRMIAAIKDQKYFRFFDSGDIYCVELAEKIEQIVKGCPNTKFWIPTRSDKIPAIKIVVMRIHELPNAVVRLSADNINCELRPIMLNSSVVISKPMKSKPNFLVCQSSNNEGKCGDCRGCWSKNIKTIAYPAHGIAMKSVIRKMKV